MPLTAPTIKSEVSECSQHILTEGNLSGATVKVYQNSATEIGHGTASSSQHWVAIDPGVVLHQGDTITATQTVGSDTSPPTPEPKEVQGTPANPPAPIFKTHLYGCASCLWLGGMVPGATYTVMGQNQSTLADEVRSTGTSGGGSSHVTLNQSLWAGEKLMANEDACGALSGFANSQPAEAYPLSQLPPPKVDGPLYKCDTNIYGSDCVEGFFVWMRRKNGAVTVQESDSCSLGGANFRVMPPDLDEGEEVFMWLESHGKGGGENEDERCPDRSADSATETVLGLDLIPPPHVVEPLCDGGVVVTLTNLRPGAKVIITHDGVEYIGQATGTGQQDFHVAPLTGGKTVIAIMEICGVKTGKSNEVTVKPQPALLDPPVVQDPLYSCTDVVHVSNIHPGALVLVYSQSIGLIGAAYVYNDEADITVAPGLMEDDKVYAVQKGCGLKSDDSNVVTVLKPEDLPKPEIVVPLYDCGEYVEVKNVVPGAIVEIYVNGNFAGDATVSEGDGSVKIDALLEEDDQVKARQRLCDLISEFSVEVSVEAFIGIWEDRGWYDTAGNPISDSDKILAVHATLLKTGKILFFGGDQHTGSLNDSNDIDHTRLLDVDTFRIQTITGLISPPSDVFCAGHSQTAGGDLLVAGGTFDWRLVGEHIDHAAPGHFIGLRDTWIFDADSESWVRKGLLNHERPADFVSEHLASWQADPANAAATPQEIADKTAELTAQSDPTDAAALIHATGGKWYPTLVTLPDGKILCVSGHAREEDSRHNNNSLEIYDTATGDWALVGTKDADLVPRTVGRSYEYPRLVVLSDGTVFSSYNMQDGNVHKWTVGPDSDAWTMVAGSIPEGVHSSLNGSAVLLPFRLVSGGGYAPDKVLMTGGVQPRTIEPTSAAPSWQSTATRKLTVGTDPPRRRNHGSVILPTGEIFIEGGVQVEDDDGTGVLAAELYDPVADEWFTLPEASVVRNYHHVSLLLPDGSVYVGGSNINAGPGLAARIFDIEVFKPWYFCRDRPRLENVPAAANHGQSFTITSPDYERIAKVVVVKCGTTTHNFNSDQRLVELPLSKNEKPGDMTVEMTDDANIAIVGYYLLFVLDRENVPSLGQFIQVRPKSNCFIATAVYGPDSPEVGILRDWRDELRQSAAGRLFVKTYGIVSPPVARFLRRWPRLQRPVRGILDRIVNAISRRDAG